jgi:hypothetical protein
MNLGGSNTIDNIMLSILRGTVLIIDYQYKSIKKGRIIADPAQGYFFYSIS